MEHGTAEQDASSPVWEVFARELVVKSMADLAGSESRICHLLAFVTLGKTCIREMGIILVCPLYTIFLVSLEVVQS